MCFLNVVCLSIFYFASMGICSANMDISGIFLDKKGGVALINDSLVAEGDTVQGAQVVKITADHVVFVRDGQEFSEGLKDPAPYQAADQKKSPASSRQASAAPVSQQSTASSSSSNPPMKTLYGMPIKNFFPDKEAMQKEMEDSMPVTNPIVAMQRANELKNQADAKRKEAEDHVKEMEGQ
jgi:hypothetical protein